MAFSEVKHIKTMGNALLIQYADGTVETAFPTVNGIYLPANTSTPVTVPDPNDPPPPPPPTGDWVHPLPGASMTSGFGPRPFDGVASYHYGADFSTGGGGTVTAPTDLIVTIARAGWGSGGSAGNCVKAHTVDGSHTFNFYHMVSGSIAVTEGQRVPRGAKIGIEGQTGNAYGAHLHFEVYEGNWRDPWPPPYNYGANVIDPLPLLRSHGVSI